MHLDLSDTVGLKSRSDATLALVSTNRPVTRGLEIQAVHRSEFAYSSKPASSTRSECGSSPVSRRASMPVMIAICKALLGDVKAVSKLCSIHLLYIGVAEGAPMLQHA
jgi:hypothetical protein